MTFNIFFMMCIGSFILFVWVMMSKHPMKYFIGGLCGTMIVFSLLICIDEIKIYEKETAAERTCFKTETENFVLQNTLPSTDALYKVDTDNKEITFVNSKGEIVTQAYRKLFVKNANGTAERIKIKYLIEYTQKDGEHSRIAKEITVFEEN